MTDSTRKINVLDIRSCRGGGGGPEKTILFSALATDRAAFNMHVVYLKSAEDPEFDLDKRAAALGVESFYTIDEHSKFDLAALRRLGSPSLPLRDVYDASLAAGSRSAP